MDQRGEKEEHSCQESSDHRRKRKDDAEHVEVVEEEEASAPLLASPCSLLQLLLRACAGCLVGLLHGYCRCSDDDPKPAGDDPKPAAAAVSESPQEGEGGSGGDKAAGSVSARDHHLLICRYCNCNRSERRCATVAVLVRAGGGHSGVGAAAAWPSERRFRWPWREPQLARHANGDLLTSRAWPMNRHYSKCLL